MIRQKREILQTAMEMSGTSNSIRQAFTWEDLQANCPQYRDGNTIRRHVSEMAGKGDFEINSIKTGSKGRPYDIIRLSADLLKEYNSRQQIAVSGISANVVDQQTAREMTNESHRIELIILETINSGGDPIGEAVKAGISEQKARESLRSMLDIMIVDKGEPNSYELTEDGKASLKRLKEMKMEDSF